MLGGGFPGSPITLSLVFGVKHQPQGCKKPCKYLEVWHQAGEDPDAFPQLRLRDREVRRQNPRSPTSTGQTNTRGSSTRPQPVMDSPPKPPEIVPWSFASATEPGPRRPAAPPQCCSSARGDNGVRTSPRAGRQPPPPAPPLTCIFCSPSRFLAKPGRLVCTTGIFIWGKVELAVAQNPALEAGPGAAGQHPARREHPLTSSWKRP